MQQEWDINKIKEVLPQRYPFLFIDRILEINREEGKVICSKNVTVNERFFLGHFPERPILPGVVVIEALAQASIILYAVLKPHLAEKNPDYYLGKVEVKFIEPVRVGEQLILEVHKEKILDNAGLVKAFGRVNKKNIVKANISFGVKLRNE
jgi:3-hydroxyacyl-[acyl-carrier-protein] dehydratase